MHPDLREIFHELRQHKDEFVRCKKEYEVMSQQLQQATTELANAAQALKTKVDNATAFIQSVPNLIQQAIAGAGNDSDAVAAVQAVTAQLKSDGDALVAALQSPPPAPAPTPSPAPSAPTPAAS